MLFKNPFILYFLSLLIVPILVHLFQFRKFKTEYFSNVAFLKTLQIQTRKSSKIKKWLLLFTRLLLLAALIFAFAMPYFPAKDEALKGQELVVVVDNSFSMQAQGKNGELLKKSLVDLIKNVPESQMFTLLTNENTFENISVNGFRNEIQSIDYTAVGWNLETISNRIKNLKKESIDVLLVTDGNSWESLKSIETLQPTFLIPEKEIDFNISIDSVYIQNTTELFYNLGVDIKKFGTTENPISVRILSQNKAIANQTFTAKEAKETLTFSIPKNTTQAEILIEDGSMIYDNRWFFSIPKPKKQQVMSIGEAEKGDFLSRIFSNEIFSYQSFTPKNIDYASIEKQDAVILNEINSISVALQNTLKNFVSKGGQLIFIPNENQDLASVNKWLSSMGAPNFKSDTKDVKKITTIHFNHPVYEGVFEKKITNFQYPTTQAFFSIDKQASNILSYEDDSSFLSATKYQDGLIYLFANPIEKKVSNFQNSPLIVPTFYNLGQRLQQKLKLSYTIGKSESMLVDVAMQNESMMELQNEDLQFIPLQQAVGQQTKVSFFENPTQAGNFDLIANDKKIQPLSFNYSRNESDFIVNKDQFPSEIKTTESIADFFTELQNNRNPNYIWKWLVFLGLLFLMAELFIQKFVK
jgi:hypothetical protein